MSRNAFTPDALRGAAASRRPALRWAALGRTAACLLVLGGTLAACAPQQTGSTFNSASMGRTASVSYGTIVGLRPVQVQSGGSGVGTAVGAVAGGVGGSFIGGDWRSNALAGLGGAILGGLAGNAIGGGVSGGNAVEFFVREDHGGDISVVQTNEEGLQANDRVVIVRGDRTRLSRAAGGPPPGAYVPPPTGAAFQSQPRSQSPTQVPAQQATQPISQLPSQPQGVPVYTGTASY